MSMSNRRILVTGAAGFIGAFLCRRLLEEGAARVVGLDNVNGYYDVRIKEERLRMLARAAGGGAGDADPRASPRAPSSSCGATCATWGSWSGCSRRTGSTSS